METLKQIQVQSYSTLQILHGNVQSLNNDKMDYIRENYMENFDIICLSETNLHGNRTINFSLELCGFQKILRKDRHNREWGGVACYLSNNIIGIRRYDLEDDSIELMWVEVHSNNCLTSCLL